MVEKIAEIFTRPFPYWNKIEFFKKVLYAFLLLNSISLLPIASEIYSYDGIIGPGGWNTSLPWYLQGSRGVLSVLNHPLNGTYGWVVYVFIYGQILALISGLFKFLPKLTSVLIWFFTVNLFLRGYLVFTGGEVLINFLLFYLMFIQRTDRKKERKIIPRFSMSQNILNNMFYWALLIQVCVLYFFSTFYKLLDPHWISGEALMYISRIDGFSSGIMRFLFADNLTLSIIATYAILLYQGLFPVVVWFKKLKIPFLIFGVVLHLGISFGMGIFTFGIVMVLSYLLFLNNTQIERIR